MLISIGTLHNVLLLELRFTIVYNLAMKPLEALGGRLLDSLSAAMYKRFDGTVQTADGRLGTVVETNIRKGTISLDTRDGQIACPGRYVADLDHYLSRADNEVCSPAQEVPLLKEPTAQI